MSPETRRPGFRPESRGPQGALGGLISNSKDQFSFSHIEMITTQEHQDIIKKVIDPRVAFSLHNKQEKFSPPGDKIPSVTLIMSAASKVR